VSKQKTIVHCTHLPEDTSGGPLSTEVNCYRRVVGRLLFERHDNRWVLIKGEEVIGLWDAREEALAAATERALQQPFLVRQILEWELVGPLPVPAPGDNKSRLAEEARELGESLLRQGKGVHWTELLQETSGPLATEWNFYLREIGRLLAEGHEGRWLLIKGEEIIGIWDTYNEVTAAQRELGQPVFVHRILAIEPRIRLPIRWSLWRK
jgi:hypothetical protein